MSDAADNQARAPRPGRRQGVADAAFNPNSLVGSWLHILDGEEIVAEGIVVAEPSTNIYLVELTIEGRKVQRLYPVRLMLEDETQAEWRFYDSDSEMRDAYAAWLTRSRA